MNEISRICLDTSDTLHKSANGVHPFVRASMILHKISTGRVEREGMLYYCWRVGGGEEQRDCLARDSLSLVHTPQIIHDKKITL